MIDSSSGDNNRVGLPIGGNSPKDAAFGEEEGELPNGLRYPNHPSHDGSGAAAADTCTGSDLGSEWGCSASEAILNGFC